MPNYKPNTLLMSAFKLKIIDRLLVTQISKMMLGVMTVLTVILLSQRLVRLFSKVTAGELSADVVLSLVGFNLLLLMIKILPVALLLSILLVLGRMYRDHEMTALFSSGIGLTQIYRGIFIFVVPLFALTIYLSLVTAPTLMQAIERVKTSDQANLDIRGITDGRFNEYSRGDLVFYVEKITSDDKMLNVFIQNRQHGKLGITSSKSGEIKVDPVTGDRFIILKDGNRYEGVPGQADYKITNFKEYGVVVAEKSSAQVSFGTKETSTIQLMAMKSPRAISELQKRWSVPLALITFALLAVPISRVSPRAGMYGNLLTALLIYIVFENFMSLSHSWLVKGVTAPWFGIWWVHLLLIGVTAIMVVNMHGVSYVKKKVMFKR
ncbi:MULTISPECIES: LPS export ABC transporter permease LptF [Cycloclasticus]|nr:MULTISPECIES: LPS export ABC transporter permease LptF [Cycloclasticus]AFT66439.1 permease transmembrane protein [Cycloclasticus sp. P1]MDF1829648.1 LPS export ABC transporter permease LptF [Cycloclasticus pugetii]SHJ53545.1 lipopolysaccharide export system permease protein [Cycloclasticus pugetii]